MSLEKEAPSQGRGTAGQSLAGAGASYPRWETVASRGERSLGAPSEMGQNLPGVSGQAGPQLSLQTLYGPLTWGF